MGFFVKNENKGAGVLDWYVEHFIFIFCRKDRKSGPTRKMLNSYEVFYAANPHDYPRSSKITI